LLDAFSHIDREKYPESFLMIEEEIKNRKTDKTENTNASQEHFSYFWSRIFAFALDIAILMTFGFIISLFIPDYLVRLGDSGRILGLFIAAFYYSIFNSFLGKGQTLGKRAFNLKVIDKSGRFASLLQSCLRFSIMGLPFFLNNTWNSAFLLSWVFIFFIGLLLSIVLGINVYLFVFKKNNKRLLHDLIAGTYVEYESPKSESSSPEIKKATIVVIGIILFVLYSFYFFLIRSSNLFDFSVLENIQDSVQKANSCYGSHIGFSNTFQLHDGVFKKITRMDVEVVLKKRPLSYDEAIKKIMIEVSNATQNYKEVDLLTITVKYGFDIGIFSKWEKQTLLFP
jgi:uncharacterized RDD family membrane protein YckC